MENPLLYCFLTFIVMWIWFFIGYKIGVIKTVEKFNQGLNSAKCNQDKEN